MTLAGAILNYYCNLLSIYARTEHEATEQLYMSAAVEAVYTRVQKAYYSIAVVYTAKRYVTTLIIITDLAGHRSLSVGRAQVFRR